MRASGEDADAATERGPQAERGAGGIGTKEVRFVKSRPKAGLGPTAEASPGLAPAASEKSAEEWKTIVEGRQCAATGADQLGDRSSMDRVRAAMKGGREGGRGRGLID